MIGFHEDEKKIIKNITSKNWMFIEYHKLLRFIHTYLLTSDISFLSMKYIYVVSEDSALHLYVRGV